MTRTDYPGGSSSTDGGILAYVTPGSPAARAGLKAGDVIRAIDSNTLRDVLDWQWHTSGLDAVTIDVDEAGTTRAVVLRREPDQAWGLTFESALFDTVRTCRNSCVFCFMTQLPRGLRPALYLRDDDFRLSFLQGNFVTLTNLDDQDVRRIVDQSLSPLYVSVHAVSPSVRGELICAEGDVALDRLDALLAEGILIHAQIVLVPGVNDGPELSHTLGWLAQREGIESVGIVPLGYTAHQDRFTRSYNEPAAAKALIAEVSPWQEAFRERDGMTWVHLADEFYLNADVPLPPTKHYDGFPQYENGIGIARSFIDETADLAERLHGASEALTQPVTLVTSTMAAPVVRGALRGLGLDRIDVLEAPNAFFGGNVSVSGLLTADDIENALRPARTDGIFLVPDVIANEDGLTLDGVSAEDLAKRTDRDVRLVSSDAAGLLRGLESASAEPVHPEGA